MLPRKLAPAVRYTLFACMALALTSCSEPGGDPGARKNAGGAPATGGASPYGGNGAGTPMNGGAPASGGSTEPRGGAAGISSGAGGDASGGVAAAAQGGSVASGGADSAGGDAASGPVAGGSAMGGASMGGASATGGTAGSGGAGGTSPEPFVPGVAPAAAAYFKKGINLGNRMEAPNEGDWGGSILATDLPFIAKRGFDHVRIPIRFSGHASASAPYTIDAAFFARVDAVLDQAAQAKLAVVLDLHAYDELASDVAAHRARYLALWTQIATRYRDRPDTVAFELMNEPHEQLDTSWNELLAAAVQAVRATNPRRLLVIDAVYWADPSKLSALVLPNDANLLVAVHIYEPKLFSFQGKDWMGPEFMTTGVIFPGPPATPVTPVAAATAADWAKTWFADYNSLAAATNPSGPATIAAQMAYVTSYRTSSGRAVYNGEWGPQDGGALDSRVRLVSLLRQECEKAGVGWAIWEDPNNMKLFDSTASTWVTEIADALLPP
ncbi:MAG TPA: glycoside hydrolase family 5 protein [Polyangiaceae bacterium]|nr:glycoside hydrolase family 5 protein [Polyangiaceae bacterium]